MELRPTGTSHLPDLVSLTSECPLPGSRGTRVNPAWKPPRSEQITRFSQGLLATGLLDDLRTAGATTLLAPVDEAFDGLPFPFDALLYDPRWVEARFDVFEYLVVRGAVEAHGPRTPHVTMQGEPVRVGRGLVFGRFGAARILRSFASGPVLVHVLDQCVFPVYPRLYMVESEPWPSGLATTTR